MTKLDTLKGMLRRWKLTHSIVDAADICEFLVENLDIESKREQRLGLMDAFHDEALMQRVMKKAADMQAETIKKAEGEQ